MRYHGTIIAWKDEQGYGFITPRGGGNQVFVHIKAFANTSTRPSSNDQVTYEVTNGKDGRPRAERLEFVGSKRGYQWQNWLRSPASLAALAFFLVLTVIAAMTSLSFAVPAYYFAMSLIAWLMYGFDKRQAGSNGWRIAENSLHLIALLGGWPGAFVAQQHFRHKNRKRSFMFVFWALSTLNIVVPIAYWRFAA